MVDGAGTPAELPNPRAQAQLVAPDINQYLLAPTKGFTAQGGKRIRPVLVCLAAALYGMEPARAAGVATSIELFQTAALIHDDIADNSLTRRGAPCLHLTQGEGIAINCGDLALIDAFQRVLASDAIATAELRVELLRELQTMMAFTVEGQALDLGWARDGRWDVTPAEYLTMATYKTAHYSAATPLVMGARLAGAPREDVERLRTCGLMAGLAFQLVDDVLNLVGDAAAQGKDFRSDLTEGKRTLLVVYALDTLPAGERARLIQMLESHTHDARELAAAVALIERAGAVEYVQNLAARYAATVEATLASMHFDQALPGAVEALAQMPHFFVARRA